jgi:hypothetical protein
MSDHTKYALAAMTTDRDAWKGVAEAQRELAIELKREIKRLRRCIRLIVEASRAESLPSGGFDVVEAIRELREGKK